jgi:cobalt-zinc-cadmium efflux system outer membrane protein
MSLTSLVPLVVVAGLSLAGCATPGVEAVALVPRPLGRDVPTYQPSRTPSATAQDLRPLTAPTGLLTLRQVLALTLLQNPELAVFAWETRASEARILQAGVLPNPELSVTVENVAGSGAFKGVRGAETTLRLSQVLELGGKRLKRIRVAALERDRAAWDYEAKRLDVLTQVTLAFVDALGAQARLGLQEELVHLAEDVLRTVGERVKAGKVSPVEETRASVALSTSRLARERVRHELEAARKRLATLWGNPMPTFAAVTGNLETMTAIPTIGQVAERLGQQPETARWVTEIAQRQATVALETARQVPDLTVSGGLRYMSDTGDQALVAEVSVPLPVFNRNQGSVLEAHYRLARAQEESRAAALRAHMALATAYAALSTAFHEATQLQTDILPGAQRAFAAVNEGYRQGKFALVDVLDAQRTLFEARGQYLEALVAYHRAVAEVERFIGEALDAVPPAPGIEPGEQR